MKRQKRTVIPNAVHHSYQRSIDGKIVFYTSRDAIVYYTIFMVWCKKLNITLLDLCLMAEHSHALTIPKDNDSLERLYAGVNNQFVKEFNSDCGRDGPLFESPFGSAPKLGAKKIRTSISYVANNPVERRLCPFAKDYIWNFLAFFNNSNPFSAKISRGKSRKVLRNALTEVQNCYDNGQYIGYARLDRLNKNLRTDEKEQLRDFIIATYNVIDYEKLISFYGSYDKMIEAINSNTGSEYDINEVIDYKSDDKTYRELNRVILRSGKVSRIKDILRLSLQERKDLAIKLSRATGLPGYQIKKYLHLPLSSN